jgi:hypothetical protein
LDFIGFTFNGKHSLYDLNIYRVSDSNMYKFNWGLAQQDNITQYESNPIYFLNSDYKEKEISVAIAFDSLTE